MIVVGIVFDHARQIQGIESCQRFAEARASGGSFLACGEKLDEILDLRQALRRQLLQLLYQSRFDGGHACLLDSVGVPAVDTTFYKPREVEGNELP